MKALEKYDEAKYFLDQMKINNRDKRAFKHNLSGFLSSARSVTFILQKGYARDPDFVKWYKKKQEEMKKDELLKFFVTKRNHVVKISPIEPEGKVSLNIYETLTISESVIVTLKKPNGTEEIVCQTPEPKAQTKPEPKEAEIEYEWFFEEYPDKDIVALCEVYLDRLKEVLEEAKKIVPP